MPGWTGHPVVVRDAQRPHPGGGQIHQGGGAQPPGADYQDATGGELFLAGQPHLFDGDLPGVPGQLFCCIHHHSP